MFERRKAVPSGKPRGMANSPASGAMKSSSARICVRVLHAAVMIHPKSSSQWVIERMVGCLRK